MINDLSGAAAFAPQQSPAGPQRLSNDQRQLITDTLSEFDADKLMEADAQSIVETFKEAGIRPGRELAELMSESGFDAKTVGELAGNEPPGNMTGQAGTTSPQSVQNLILSDDDREQLTSLVEQLYSGELEDDAKDDVLASIREILEANKPEKGLVDITV